MTEAPSTLVRGHSTTDLREDCAVCLRRFELLEKKSALDDFDLQLDIREAMVEFREQLCADLPPRATCPQIANQAEAKRLEAITAVEFAQMAVGGEELAKARRYLDAFCTKSAADALTAVADVDKTCEGKKKKAP